MSFEVNFTRVSQNLNSIMLSEEGNMLQEIAKPESKTLKSLRISENKLLRLFLKDQKYFVELIASGYSVTHLAGKTLEEAENCYVELLHKIKNGGSMLEPC